MTKWRRYRFYANLNDYRPVKWPALGPYWCSGESDTHSVVIAYLPADVDLKEFWPEAIDVEFTDEMELHYSDRFPKPGWWHEIEQKAGQ